MKTKPSSEETTTRDVLIQHPEVKLAILFGSLTTDRASRDSDLDIAVSLGHAMTSDEKFLLFRSWENASAGLSI